jgi:hypothetical protein
MTGEGWTQLEDWDSGTSPRPSDVTVRPGLPMALPLWRNGSPVTMLFPALPTERGLPRAHVHVDEGGEPPPGRQR